VRITVLVDDSALGSRGLLAEHGFAALISVEGGAVLLDAGQTGLPLVLNALRLGADLPHLSAVVLSHGHYDHTGGLRALAQVLRTRPLLVAHPLALKPAVVEEGGARSVGIPYSEAFLGEHFRLVLERGVVEVAPRVYFLGEVPRYRPELACPVPGTYVVEGGRLEPHTFADDTAVAVDLGEGLLVLTGCGHSGLVNAVLHAERALGKPVAAVLGGFHLVGRPPGFVERVVGELEGLGVARAYPGHCTGPAAAVKMLERLGGEALRVGFTLEL